MCILEQILLLIRIYLWNRNIQYVKGDFIYNMILNNLLKMKILH